MKIVVTHKSPDLDAITSVWLIKKFLPEWQGARTEFVPAGQKFQGHYKKEGDVVEIVGNNSLIHVDTGLGKLDHHQFQDETICAASLTFDYVNSQENNTLKDYKYGYEALEKIIDLVIDEDHFQQVFYQDSDSYIREFTLVGILDGLKLQQTFNDSKIVEIGMQCLDALFLSFISRVEAEVEFEQKGSQFKTKWGDAIAFETVNDTVMKVAQLKGYSVVVRQDPSNHLVRIKAHPRRRSDKSFHASAQKEKDIDLTPVYKILKEKDQYASWFLHASKRMLLNGSSKNPNTVPTKLELEEIIKLLESIE